MTSVLSEYLQLFSKYKTQYGENTAVLMQVGGFYEVYGIDNNTEKRGNSVELSRILNITLTRKNKKIPENSWHNPLMLGFPCLALNKYITTLLEVNFTVVVVDQVKTSLAINRVVANVVSPSTYIDSNKDECLVLIYLNKVKKDMHVGISAINIQTGHSVVHECYSEYNDEKLSLDETISFLKQHRPREVVYCTPENLDKESLASYLDLDSNDILCHYKEVNKTAHNVNYQNSLLGNFFENKTMLSNIEYLDLERKPYALLSFVLLIEFVYCHNPLLLKKISPPDIFSPSHYLILATNTIDQLNLVGKRSKDNLFSIINKCSTSVGKRLLMKRLMTPIFDVANLEKRYQQIEEFGTLFKKPHEVEQLLEKIVDIERLQRRMSLGIMTPNELASLNSSYCLVLELNNLLQTRISSHDVHRCLENPDLGNRGKDPNLGNLGKDKGKNQNFEDLNKKYSIFGVILNKKPSTVLKKFTDACNSIFNLDNLVTHDFDDCTHSTLFKKGIFTEIDELHDNIQNEINKINNIASYLSSIINNDYVKVDYLQSTGHYLTISNARAKKLHNNLPGKHNFVFKSNKATTKVTSPDIDTASKNILILQESLSQHTKKRYKQTAKCLLSSYSSMFNAVTAFVSEIDVIKSNWIVSCMYNYCRPVIKSSNAKNSFINATNLRHPIIERIDNGSTYVPNNLSIGTDPGDPGKGYNGIILYSMNSCGKTSLLKACGLSVILAQAGCYVPASSFTYYPFKCIMTRILSEDNIMKGQSSFVAEMSELRSILRRAQNRQTLVLADEITHGTEHTSGSSIFIASVETLAKKKVNFMFTTHLHNVYPFVKDIPNVRVFHLSIAFDNKNIIFERKLSNGPGNSTYGLEVCEFLNMDKDFLARAFQVRNMITSDKTNTTNTIKLSRYNKNKTVQHCEICKYSPKVPTDMPLDVHHITQQSIADCNGMINGTYKHAKSNLVTLCKQCHVKTHKGQITVSGYKDTSNGKVLHYCQ